jgi:hypothetical protein
MSGTARRAAAASRCFVKDCTAGAAYTAVLHLAQRGKHHVSRVALPVHVCPKHRGVLAEMFLTAERRSKVEGALRLRGRAPPDWSRTTVEFVGL